LPVPARYARGHGPDTHGPRPPRKRRRVFPAPGASPPAACARMPTKPHAYTEYLQHRKQQKSHDRSLGWGETTKRRTLGRGPSRAASC